MVMNIFNPQNIFVRYDMEHFEEDEDRASCGKNHLWGRKMSSCVLYLLCSDDVTLHFCGFVSSSVVCGEHRRRELVRELREQQ